jgi:hypothetical protein
VIVASLAGDVQADLPIRRRRRGIVRSAALRRDAFSLLNGISMGFRSGGMANTFLAHAEAPWQIAVRV